MGTLIAAIISLLMIAPHADAGEQPLRWAIPDYSKYQFAGGTGKHTLGIGYRHLHDHLENEMLVGYVPADNGAASITTLALRPSGTWAIIDRNSRITERRHAGASFNLSFTRNTFVKLPDHYPSGYYPPNAFQLMFFTGRHYTIRLPENRVATAVGFGADVGIFLSDIVETGRTGWKKLPRVNVGFATTTIF